MTSPLLSLNAQDSSRSLFQPHRCDVSSAVLVLAVGGLVQLDAFSKAERPLGLSCCFRRRAGAPAAAVELSCKPHGPSTVVVS